MGDDFLKVMIVLIYVESAVNVYKNAEYCTIVVFPTPLGFTTM